MDQTQFVSDSGRGNDLHAIPSVGVGEERCPRQGLSLPTALTSVTIRPIDNLRARVYTLLVCDTRSLSPYPTPKIDP